ncbi:hypothetical protein ACFSE1_14125 [Rhizobium helianthi]|uniref:DUF2946 domain-containing protein n=1 Tax=Rhizobium helianthi TaxID=1132695 RepID=A0ABW4M8L2_9HYPH
MASFMKDEERNISILLGKGLTIVLLGYALVIQLFVGAYLQQSMVVQSLNGGFVICSSHAGGIPPLQEQPADPEGKAQCLTLCQLACGVGPALQAHLRFLPSHAPDSFAIRWTRAVVGPGPSLAVLSPQARGPPANSMIL